MKKLLFCLLMAVAVLPSCKKGEDNTTVTPTGTNNNNPPAVTTGTIQFVNNSVNPYRIYINGDLKTTLSGGAYITYTVSLGTYSCRVLQTAGYVLYPTDQTYTCSITATDNSDVVSFP